MLQRALGDFGRLPPRGAHAFFDSHHFLTALAYVYLNLVRARMVDRAGGLGVVVGVRP